MAYLRSVRVPALLAVLALAVFAQQGRYVPYREKLPDGVVNWDEGWIRADASVPLQKGLPPAQARVNAQRVALIQAQATALRIALRLPVNGDQRLEAFEALKVHVRGIVAGGQVESEGLKDGRYTLSLKVPINGVKGIVAEVSKVTLPPEPEPPPGPRAEAPKKEQPTPQAAAPEAEGPGQAQEAPSLSAFASVTVDATEAGVKPALQPRILDPEGKVVYGIKTVKPLVAREKSLARYVTPAEGGPGPSSWIAPGNLGPLPLALITPPWRLLAQAQREPSGRRRGQPEPLLVQASAASGTLKADIVVTEETARRLREADAASGVLSDGHVVVVVRADVGGVEGRFRLRPRSDRPLLASK